MITVDIGPHRFFPVRGFPMWRWPCIAGHVCEWSDLRSLMLAHGIGL